MNAMSPSDIATDELSRHIASHDAAAAHDLVQRLLGTGWSIAELVTDLLASTQRRIGQEWQAGRCTIAEEHAASAVVEDLLGSLARLVPPPRSRATVALVCAEGEWHVTPARMAALLLRQAGWRTAFLGGSTPIGHLERSLGALRPDFVAISCTDPRFLLGAGRVADLARRLELPSIAGGAGFGDGDTRARALGITGWAPDAASASAMLHRWQELPLPEPSATSVPRGQLDPPDRRHSAVTEQAIQRLAASVPTVLPHGAQPLEDVRRDLGELLHVAHVAAVCRDPGLLEGFVRWLADVRPPRGLPHEAVEPSVRILRELTDRFDDGSTEVLATVAD